MLEKAYDAKQFEDNIYQSWEKSGFFNPDVCIEKGITDSKADHFSMVLPPPNVTGTLHMGHAVMLAVQDLMTRYARMQGKRTLWLPGTDHAAIATESKVEKMLIDDGMEKPKEKLGRDAFLSKVEQFAQDSHDTIVNQAKKMGASLDWSREAYTLDEQRNFAVKTVFKQMFEDGLIYRGYRVINWSVKGQSTCSDDELVYKERQSVLYTFKYSEDFPIPISTTRPETKVGDTAVAVHPEGKWKKYIGKTFTIDNVGQIGHTLTIQVFGDENVDDNFGTGALGVTTAHSPIDFEMYQKQKALGNDIGLIQVIGEDGNMTAEAGSEYEGLTVAEAREKFVQYLQDNDLLISQEDTIQNVGTSDRYKDVVEALPKTQWFIDVQKAFTMKESHIEGIKTGQDVTLKQLMQHVVRSGQIKILPERFEKTYFNWIDNLRDWNISRQIWFGHQIPVWYKGDETYVGIDAPEGDGWEQDPDTLDTWFSSGLWTFSTLGFPNEENELAQYHPTSILETGYDIIFFWVARMILMSTYTVGQIPFETVYLHGLVRDEKGRKMSKSLGNIIDPLDMNAKFGTDATRLSLIIGQTPGNDMKLSEEKVAGFRNFTNKLWNISRFMLMNIKEPKKDIAMPKENSMADAWILSELSAVTKDATEKLDQYQFSAVGEMLRDFTWNKLADWYLEIAKLEEDKDEILNYILNTLLALWHPFMPFVTETIWKQTYGEDEMLMVEKWPSVDFKNEEAVQEMENVQEIITGIRALRAEKNIPPAKKLNAVILSDNEHIVSQSKCIAALSRLDTITIDAKAAQPAQSVSGIYAGIHVMLDIDGAVDTKAEIDRIEKEIAHVEPYVISLEKKLSNDSFVSNAPEQVIAQEKEKLEDAKLKLANLKEQLASL